MNEETKQFESSIFPKGAGPAPVKENQFALPTWAILVFLFITFFVLKAFIYIKDEKRHGK